MGGSGDSEDANAGCVVFFLCRATDDDFDVLIKGARQLKRRGAHALQNLADVWIVCVRSNGLGLG
jgi:hypothetical protein